ncbi:MAG TPA: bifunctional ADP-dependent NAD(P)H-hydrate dehydratase/NAD(P)H-hydrate epimerase [Blastocatellia bacterium]|jgi:NAD(P)H-hydrate epimerase|nr:bifunctional ADP-dependent NAD(P)H-hydrate dehydratase/NAD(P)H-hydrate epimerase [Blastocatellia bacterium]
MRQIDRLTTQDYQIPSSLLMQAAAEACFQTIAAHFGGNLAGKKAQILCGPGNNGGDGAALAQELARAGVHADVVLFGKVENAHADARANFEIVRRLSGFAAGSKDQPSRLSLVECTGVSAWEDLAKPRRAYDIIVDALFGTGLRRPLEGVFVQVVQHLAIMRRARESSATVRPLIVSIDIPSGLNADLAQPIGEAVHADLTVTFTAPKPANVLPPASHLNGKLAVADIGAPSALVEAANPTLFVTEANDVRQWLVSTRYAPESFKNTHGHALIIAGSRGYTGAAVLCGDAAIRAGAGLVTIATPASAQSSIAASVMPEVMTTALAETDRGAVSDKAADHVSRLASKVSVIAIGPGLSAEDERTRRFVFSVVKTRETSVVIDADALNCLATYDGNGWPPDLSGSKESPLVLTPHAGEMLRLLGTNDRSALDDRVAVARNFATRNNLILVLKGSRALIAAPDGRVFINPTGNAGLGTAGAGDTLTGIIAGFIAQAIGTLKEKADVLSATVAAVYIGGLAGDIAARDRGMRTMVASDIREHLSEAVCSLDAKGETP